jgi:hypothetical protein
MKKATRKPAAKKTPAKKPVTVFKDKVPLPMDPVWLDILMACDGPRGRERSERLQEYLGTLTADFREWQALVVTDKGVYAEPYIIWLDRRTDVCGGYVEVTFRRLEIVQDATLRALIVFDNQHRCVGQHTYDDMPLRAGDVLNLNYKIMA